MAVHVTASQQFEETSTTFIYHQVTNVRSCCVVEEFQWVLKWLDQNVPRAFFHRPKSIGAAALANLTLATRFS